MGILVLGASGQLGMEFQRYFTKTKTSFVAVDRKTCDISRPGAITAILDKICPELVINCTAYNLVDDAEDNPVLAFTVNADAVGQLADACMKRKIKLVHYSTDYVFNGDKHHPYVEGDNTSPLNVYGKSKLAGEKYVLEMANGLVFRTSWLIGSGKQNFLYKVRQWIDKNDVLRISEDEISVPTLAATIVEVTDRALKKDLSGLYHLTNTGEASRYEVVLAYLDAMGVKGTAVIPVPRASFPLRAKRPGYSVMSNSSIRKALGIDIPHWRESLKKYIQGELGI